MSKRVGFKKTGGPVTHTRAWREFRGLTQAELAELAGCSHATISRLERGDSSVTLQAIATVAGALGTDAITLQKRGPTDTDDTDELSALWDAADERARTQILSIAKTIVRD